MKISALYRYPVKGLSAEALDEAELTAGGYFPGDRIFAIENGPSGFDPDDPEHQPKIKFLMLMRDEQLAKLSTRYDDATGVLTIARDGKQVCRADLSQPIGRTLVEQFFAAFMQHHLRGAPKLLEAPDGFRFTDSAKGFVSLINLASVSDLTRVVGRAVEPLRFRGNVYFDGLKPWHEFDLIGKKLAIGDARLEVLKRISRCAATNVNPVTAERDLNIPNALMRGFDHTDCGIYARVLNGGCIRPGDTIKIAA
ncbi:MOSC domain-containing protein [Methylovirgula sp. 4M-Z18]|uniref:MOSC domain-containing protein n=1 Tax=Methylovirgula sp. 4M-Z18 TaxID=2293567 RepID=UPI000E2E50BD|nr:MOSC N-terminal beta barrel domain-containing protein [Methylovirgula sp. 4M-Z18]RFB81224.1 MOSC domain-containing protein [Methylovirgula sp. 4M-Z18]